MAKKNSVHSKDCDFQIGAPSPPDAGHPENDVSVADNHTVQVTVYQTFGDCIGFKSTIGGEEATLGHTAGTTAWSGPVNVGVFMDTAPGLSNCRVSVTSD